MAWSVRAKPGFLTSLPIEDRGFSFVDVEWSYEALHGGARISELVHDAPGSFAIFRRDKILDLLKGLGDKGKSALKSLYVEPNVAFTWFSFFPEDSSKEVGVMLGLDDESFAVVENDLRAAMAYGEAVSLQATGALCPETFLDQSYQRTVEQFELGHALALFDPSLTIARKELLK
jgi:hypothetical protein